MNNMYYTPNNGPGWRVESFEPEEEVYVVTIEEGYEDDTEYTEHEFPYPITSEVEAVGAMLTLSAFANSTGPISGGAFPKKL